MIMGFFHHMSSAHRIARLWLLALCVGTGSLSANEGVIRYECNLLPEETGWRRVPAGQVQGERRVENGWYIQTLSVANGGSQSFFEGDIDVFEREPEFFVEWRAINDGPARLVEVGDITASMSAYGQADSWYRTTFGDSAAALFRDPFLPFVVADTSPGVPHIYRLEVYMDEYLWYIDGVVADSGVPEGPYPDANAGLSWGTRRNDVESATTAWDYIRVGCIPDDASGDFDNDNRVDEIDRPFVIECIGRDGPGIFGGPEQNAGPGCRFTDFDLDGDVDLWDIAEFQNEYEEFPCEPPFCP